MALPAPSDLPGLDYQDMGRPFIEYSVKELDLGSMDYQDMGRPFVRNFTMPVASGIKVVNTLERASIKIFNGATLVSIRKLNNVSNV